MTLKESVSDDLGNNYSDDFFNNVQDGMDQLQGFVDYATEKTKLFTIAKDKVDDFSNQIGEMSADIAKLVQAPVDMAQSISNLFDTIEGMYETTEAAFDVMSSLFGFGDDDEEIKTDTASRIGKV